MQQPDSGAAPDPQPPGIEPPRPVLFAVRLMYAGAALEVIALIVTVLTAGSVRSALAARHPGYTAAQLHAAEVVRTVPVVVGAVLTIGLWIWMARENGKGRNWARFVSAAFFGINTVDLLISLILVAAAATLVMGLVIWLVGLAAIVLIFSTAAGPFYRQQQPAG